MSDIKLELLMGVDLYLPADVDPIHITLAAAASFCPEDKLISAMGNALMLTCGYWTTQYLQDKKHGK